MLQNLKKPSSKQRKKEDKLKDTIERINNIKDYAKLGDSLINFLFSAGLTLATSKPTGIRIKDKDLAKAIHNSGLRKYIPHRKNSGELADYAEALLAYQWLKGDLTLEDTIKLLAKTLRENSMNIEIALEILLRQIIRKINR